MDIIDRQLLGKDLCGNECVDNKSIIHPETCADQVLTECNGSKTLTEWIDEDPDQEVHHGSFSAYNNLISWLTDNYPTSTYTLPIATYSNISSPKIGGVIINPSHFTISQLGVLDIDTESLNIPSEVETTTYETEGKVALGNDTQLPINLANSTIHDTSSTVNVYPLRLDAYNHAGIAVPKADIQIQSDWNQSNDSSVDYIKNKPTIPTVNNSIVTVQQGGVTKSTFTLNQNSNVTVSLDDTDVPVATSSEIGGIKIGYVEDGELKPVLLDSGNKAYVNISNSSLKNHEVTDINQVAHDEHSNYFNTYTVRCNISNENLTVTNVNDFKQAGNGYNNIQSIDTDDTYEWNISSAGVSNNIAIIHAISTAAKGYFQLIIDHDNNGEHIIETHNVGFVIDTPPTYTFAWFSTCNWSISLYGDGNIGSNACRVYLTAPSDFTGTVKITDIHLVTASGDNVGSMSSITYKKWSAGDPFSNGSVTNITGTQVTGDFKIPVDSFITLSESPSVGDFLYDSEINDTLIHNLLVRVKAIELWIQSQQ